MTGNQKVLQTDMQLRIDRLGVRSEAPSFPERTEGTSSGVVSHNEFLHVKQTRVRKLTVLTVVGTVRDTELYCHRWAR